MGSSGYPILTFFFLCVIPLGIGLIVVLGIRGLPLSKRGIQSVIQMDGANFLKTADGNIKVKRRTFFTWLMAILFGACALGLIIGVINSSELSLITQVVPFILLFGFFLFLNVRILGRPSVIQFEVHSRTITIGKGATAQQIPFSQVNEVFLLQSTGIFSIKSIRIGILTNSNKMIEIGSVSGTNAQTRAGDIVQQIAEAAGIKIRGA